RIIVVGKPVTGIALRATLDGDGSNHRRGGLRRHDGRRRRHRGWRLRHVGRRDVDLRLDRRRNRRDHDLSRRRRQIRLVRRRGWWLVGRRRRWRWRHVERVQFFGGLLGEIYRQAGDESITESRNDQRNNDNRYDTAAGGITISV